MGWWDANLVGIVLISVVVAVDNALLAGLLVPHTSHGQKMKVLVLVGILLGISQILLASGVDFLLDTILFRIAAIFLLSWMSVKMLALLQPKRQTGITVVILKTWLYTVVGSVDNTIWLGSELKGDRLWLVLTTAGTIPLFITVALFLAEQCERQQWILPLGAGMMAWAAASLTMDIPLVNKTLDDAPRTTIQCIITVCILVVGFGIRHLAARRGAVK